MSPEGLPPDESDRSRQRAAEDLFDRVRELPIDERESAIDGGTTDPWVRAEVRSLLRFDASTIVEAEEPATSDFSAQSCLGMTVDGFTLRSVIGVGGMGTVFEAEQELPARRIAVKVLHGTANRPSTLARFRKESEFLARLDHPCIARIIAAGTLHLPSDGSARPYFAMELVDGGRSITRWAREVRADRRAVVDALATACEAVGSGHRAGIAHLDLKPANLLVSQTGALRVIDYGIARSIDDAARDGGAPFAGTPQYMSPEQCTRGAVIDSRADVYALGLILYELLAERLPYQTRGQPFSMVAQTVREQMPPRLPLVDATIPRDLDAIVQKAIAKDPNARYGTASELGDDLRRWLADEPVLAAPQRPSDAVLRLVRRNPLVATLGAIALLAILAAGIISVVFAVRMAEAAEIQRIAAARGQLQAACAAISRGEPAAAVLNLSRVPEDLRGWTARHVNARTMGVELYGAADSEVLSVDSIDATGEVVGGVTGGYVEIVHRTSGQPPIVYDLRPYFADRLRATVLSVSASADGQTIFAVTSDLVLFAIDRRDDTITRIANGVLRAEPSGRLVACLLTDGAMALADPVSRSFVARTPAGPTFTRDASIAKNGRSGLVALEDGSLRMIDIDPDALTVRERWLTKPNPARTRAPGVSPDGSTVIVAWKDGRITRHDPATGDVTASADLPGGSVFALAISPDNRTVAASSWSNQIRLIDAESLAIRQRLSGTRTHIWGIDFSADGSRVFGRVLPLAGGGNGEFEDFIGGWPVGEEAAVSDSELGHSLEAVAVGPERSRFTAIGVDGALIELDARDGSSRQLGTLPSRCVSIARTDEWVVVGEPTGWVIGFRVTGGTAERAWRTRLFDQSVRALAASPDGTKVFAGENGHRLAALDPRDGSVLWKREIPLPTPPPNRMMVLRMIPLDEGRAVTFAGHFTNTRRWVFSAADGGIRSDLTTGMAFECDDACFRSAVGRIYGLGITGYITISAGPDADTVEQFALNGGVLCLNRAQDNLFVATRDGAVRVAGFDPLVEIGRLDSPLGDPLAVSFDDDSDSLTVVTNRGLARTWRGSAGQSARTAAPAVPTKRVPRLREDVSAR